MKLLLRFLAMKTPKRKQPWLNMVAGYVSRAGETLQPQAGLQPRGRGHSGVIPPKFCCAQKIF